MKKLAETCEFGGYHEEAIKDCSVCGLKEQMIQCKLFTVAELTLQTAVKRACAAQLPEKETTALHGGSVQQAKKVAVMFPECFRCAYSPMAAFTCEFCWTVQWRNVPCSG